MAQSLRPDVADNLMADQGVLSLMGQPKMVEAMRALKEDPKRYQDLVGADPELAAMMQALQARMGEAEADAGGRSASEQGAAKGASEAREARETALERAQARDWAGAVAACERGLRTASGELEGDLKALRGRYRADLERKAAARADEAASAKHAARQELAGAVARGDDLPALQAAIDGARARGLKGEPILAEAQRLLVRLLDAKSGERMRRMREEAHRAAERAAAAGPPSASAQPAARAGAELPEPAGAAAASAAAPTPAAAAAAAPAKPAEKEAARTEPLPDTLLRALVLDNPLLYEID